MSLKQEIETWVGALAHYDNNEFEESLKTFDGISDTSKILFNCGVIHATLGEHDKAVECYQKAVRLDQYLAVAYFQQGVSNFLVGDFEEALANFNDTLLYLRGNTFIDYEQLGLKFKLFSCEVLFNRGLCYIYLQQRQAGIQDLTYAVKEKVTPDHDVIDEAIREEADGYTVFSIPVGILYRPNSAKVKNLQTKDYLGKARLVASSEKADTGVGFAGTERRQMSMPDPPKDDRPNEAISFAASNLVRPDIVSRARQHSEPPASRNVFPPTPPPESDRSGFHPAPSSASEQQAGGASMSARANSVRRPPPELRSGSFRRPEEPVPKLNGRRPSDGPVSPKSMDSDRSRQPPSRSASEHRGHAKSIARAGYPTRESSTREKPRLFMETTPHRGRAHGPSGANDATDEYSDELYDLYRDTAYSNPYSATNPYGNSPRHAHSIRSGRDRGSSDDDARRASNHSSLDDFEILNDAGGVMSRPRESSRSRSLASQSRRPPANGPDVRTVRVKVHAGDDTRYVMVGTTIMFEEFLERVREKLGLRSAFRVKIKDDGDLITMGDRDDWDLAVQTARKQARKEGDDMAKMEIWIQ